MERRQRTLDIRLRPGVLFHDGTPMDAEAVKFTLERHLTMQGLVPPRRDQRAGDGRVTGPLSCGCGFRPRSRDSRALSPTRAGLIVSPRAAREAGTNFGITRLPPVRSASSSAWRRTASCSSASRNTGTRARSTSTAWSTSRPELDHPSCQPPGRLARADRARPAERDPGHPARQPAAHRSIAGVGYQGITFNVANGERARLPIGADPRVREALDLAIDRDALNQVVYGGEYATSAQPNSPVSPYHLQSIPAPARNVERARALLRGPGCRCRSWST